MRSSRGRRTAALIIDAEKTLGRLAAGQHGAVARHQLRVGGVSDHTIRVWLQRGRLEDLHRGIYGVTGAPATYYRSLMAAILAAGPGAVASHRAAIELWHLDGPEDGVVEISVPASHHPRLRGVTIHRLLDDARPVIRHGIPTTDPMRALLDLGAVCGLHAVRYCLDQARGRRLVHDDAMRRLLDNLGRQGRNGVGPLRLLYDEIDARSRPPDSPAEPRLARLLRDIRPRPQFQQDVSDVTGRWLGRADWYVDEALLTIELNGYVAHSSVDAHEHDHRRRARFKAAGIDVLEYTPKRVWSEPQVVRREIQDAIDRRLALAATGWLDQFRPPSVAGSCEQVT